MIEWLNTTRERKRQILNVASEETLLPEYSIEKDWWVTLSLKAAFSTPWARHLVFKGGTSLSKAWNLIERFSEDIDLALDREALGFEGELSKSAVKRLRRAASQFMSQTFKEDLERSLLQMGVQSNQFRLTVRATDQPDLDPRVLELHYESAVQTNVYIESRVLIEIGARSLREPCSQRPITSILAAPFPDQPFSGKAFTVETVEPKRTFLEKAFLLHEMFYLPAENKNPNRLSRHLYDLERLSNTPHAEAALDDKVLYHSIVEHRERVTPVRGIEYDKHTHDKINFIPPDEAIASWESDYIAMGHMIYGKKLPFTELLFRLRELQMRFRKAMPHQD